MVDYPTPPHNAVSAPSLFPVPAMGAQSGVMKPPSGPILSAPRNVEAEQRVLGALMLDNEIFHRIGEFLTPDHFYDPVHKRIYAAAIGLIRREQLADGVTLKEFFETDGGLSEIGGVDYLAQLIAQAGLVAAAPEYARVIYELGVRRKLIEIGGGIAMEAARPDNPRDADGQITEGERQLQELAEQGSRDDAAKSFSEALREAVELAARAAKRGDKIAGIASGLADLDRLTGGLHSSDLLILAGRPSMGKTALATNIAFNASMAWKPDPASGGKKTLDGAITLFFSLEMSADQLANRLIAERAELPSEHIRQGKLDKSQFGRFLQAVNEIERAPLFIDDTGGISIDTLMARARRHKRRHGLDLVVVDYLQLVAGYQGKRYGNRVEEVQDVTKGLKMLAKQLKVPVLALSQLSRQVEMREDKRPQLADLRESGSIEQDADIVMFVYRESYYLDRAKPEEGTPEFEKWKVKCERAHNTAEVILGKQRHGPIGTAIVGFQPEFTKFYNLAYDHFSEQYGRPDSPQR